MPIICIGDKVRFNYRPDDYPKLIIKGNGIVHVVKDTYCEVYTVYGMKAIPIKHLKHYRGKTDVRTKIRAKKPPTKKQLHTKSVKKYRKKKQNKGDTNED